MSRENAAFNEAAFSLSDVRGLVTIVDSGLGHDPIPNDSSAIEQHIDAIRGRTIADEWKYTAVAKGGLALINRENGYVESFNARLRDELLDGEIFYTLREAQIIIESWRRHYNAIRPHESLGYRPPAPEVFVPAFAAWPATRRRPASPATLAQRPHDS